jgi:hypothetical protein
LFRSRPASKISIALKGDGHVPPSAA